MTLDHVNTIMETFYHIFLSLLWERESYNRHVLSHLQEDALEGHQLLFNEPRAKLETARIGKIDHRLREGERQAKNVCFFLSVSKEIRQTSIILSIIKLILNPNRYIIELLLVDLNILVGHN